MQTGTFSRLWLRGWSWRFKIHFGWNIVRFLEVITFVPISWMCKEQTAVSHSSTESEIISLDAGLRLDGLLALYLSDLIVAVVHGNTYQSIQERRDPCTNLVRVNLHKLPTRKKVHGKIDDLDASDFVSSNVHSFRKEALLCIFEDNEIKMIIKGRSRTMRPCFQSPQSCSWLVVW